MVAGRTDPTLTVLAEAAGTSDRMLIYYFKTREALLSEAMTSIRTRLRRNVAAALATIDPADVEAGIAALLSERCSAAGASHSRLLQEAAGRAMRDEVPFVEFISDTVSDATAEAEVTARRLGAGEIDAQTFGTLFTAISRALSADALATGASERIDRAIDAAARQLTDVLALN